MTTTKAVEAHKVVTVRHLGARLNELQRKTKWSWERMCREFHNANGSEGVSHTTLFRYAQMKIKRPNKLTAKWIEEALTKCESST